MRELALGLVHQSGCLDPSVEVERSCSGAGPLRFSFLFLIPAAGRPWALHRLSASSLTLVQKVSGVPPVKLVAEWVSQHARRAQHSPSRCHILRGKAITVTVIRMTGKSVKTQAPEVRLIGAFDPNVETFTSADGGLLEA